MAEIIENQAAYILHRRPYKENSLILDIFTLNYGRLSVVAKGASKVSRKGEVKAGMLQAFQPLMLGWSGRGGLRTLRQSEMTSPAYSLQSAYLYSGYYLNELLVKLTPEDDAIPDIFIHYSRAIESLSNKADLELELRSFEYHLLTNLGLIPSFDHDALGNIIENGCVYILDAEQGFFPMNEDINSDQANLQIYSGALLQSLAQSSFEQRIEVDARLQRESKKLMRQLIDFALQGRPLKSRELFRQMVKPVTPKRKTEGEYRV